MTNLRDEYKHYFIKRNIHMSVNCEQSSEEFAELLRYSVEIIIARESRRVSFKELKLSKVSLMYKRSLCSNSSGDVECLGLYELDNLDNEESLDILMTRIKSLNDDRFNRDGFVVVNVTLK